MGENGALGLRLFQVGVILKVSWRNTEKTEHCFTCSSSRSLSSSPNPNIAADAKDRANIQVAAAAVPMGKHNKVNLPVFSPKTVLRSAGCPTFPLRTVSKHLQMCTGERGMLCAKPEQTRRNKELYKGMHVSEEKKQNEIPCF